MQTLRYETIKALVSALEKFPTVNVDMPTELWIVLAENRQKLIPTSKIVEEVLNGLIDKFKPKDRNKNYISGDDPRFPEFEAEQKKLFNKTIDIDIKTYSKAQLKEIPKLGGVPGIYTLFDFILTDNPIKDEVASEIHKPSDNGEVTKETIAEKNE